jgi:glycosyltransferase involved in cell wall biosynthesis
MRGLSQEEFAKYLKDSFVSVWVDDTSGFGTFPIESMACKTPVIGKVPNMKPDWMLDSNGVWTYELNQLPDIIAEFIQNWLEDNISEELYRSSLETASKFKNKDEFESSVISTFENYLNIRKESFVSQLDKLKVEEEN